MSKPKLAVTNRFLPAVEERLEREFDIRRDTPGRVLSSSELLTLADGTDAMFITPLDKLDGAFFNGVSNSVKVISTYSVGLDHIDLKAAAARSIPIGYTPGVNADATAEIAMLLMLGAARRAYEGQEMVRAQSWNSTSRPLLGWQLSEKSLGIVGMGRKRTGRRETSKSVRHADSLRQSRRIISRHYWRFDLSRVTRRDVAALQFLKPARTRNRGNAAHDRCECPRIAASRSHPNQHSPRRSYCRFRCHQCVEERTTSRRRPRCIRGRADCKSGLPPP
jgi:hypothetical protein